MSNLLELPSWDEQGRLRVVVETPRGSAFKVHYDPATRAFTYQRPLHTQHYPYDWGFIPGTIADDGDPLDALVLHDDATWPGIVVPSEPIAVLKIRDQKGGEEERQNDRVMVVPFVQSKSPLSRALSPEKQRELAEFFQVAADPSKRVRVLGWGDADEARAIILNTRAR